MHAQPMRVAAEGNLVFVQVQYTMNKADRGNDFAGGGGVDIHRIENGLAQEHWDVVQYQLPEPSASGRSLFSGGGKFVAD